MINFQKEINLSPEWKWGWTWWGEIWWKVADVLQFWPKLDDKRAQVQAEKPIRDFEIFCRRFRDDNSIHRIKRFVRVDEKWAYFMVDGREIKILFWLWDKCTYEYANQNYDLELLLNIFRIFDPRFDSRFPNYYDDEPIFWFFKDIMRWDFWSYIWASKETPKQDGDTQMYRAQWLTYDNQVIWWNIPEDNLWGDIANESNNSWMLVYFASNGIAIVDPKKQENPITEAFSFPK